jgi:decaprenyl-phosphate phosphoribosyltransferase
MQKSVALLRVLRPEQWIKNLFVFIPVFFAGEMNNASKWGALTLSFASFCLVASSIYIVNDLNDLEFDRQHPEKVKRPLAAGQISRASAIAIFCIIFPAGMFLSYLTGNLVFVAILTGYFLVNIGYSFGLRRISILDIIIVSSGFVLRVVGGGAVANVHISQWMVVMVFLLALFLTIAKRRDDILVFNRSGKIMRKSLEKYTLEYINSLLIMISGIIIVSYLMYVISPEVMIRFNSQYVYLTSIFVIAGVMRYLQITLVENKSGSPTRVLYQDNFIRATLIGWVFVFYFIIYG